MAEDSQSTPPEEPAEDLGQQLVQRAAAPGVIRRDLAARIQRSCCVAETGLASEIQRRFAPAGSADPWSQGPALPHAGFGGFGGAASGSPMPGLPAVQAKAASPAPVARTVGAPAASPAAESLSVLGSSLQRRHLGTAQGGGDMVQRRAMPGSPPITASTPASTSTSAPVQRSSLSIPAAGAGPAIVQRSTGSSAPDLPLRRASEPEEVEEKPGASPAPPPVQAKIARKEMGPAIVHRSAAKEMGPPVVQRSAAPDLPLRRMSEPEEDEKPAASSPAVPPVQAKVARAEMGPAIVHRSAVKETGPPVVQRSAGSPAAPDLPLRRMSEPEEDEKPASSSPEMPAVQAKAAPKETGPAIVHRSAERAPVQRAVSPALPASSASSASSAAGAPVQRAAAPATVAPAVAAPALPLVQAARPAGRGDGASGIVQAQRASGMTLSAPTSAPAPASTMGLSATAAGLTLPLARSAQPAGGAGGGAAGGGVVQRQTGGDAGMASPATEPIGGSDAGAAAPAAAPSGSTAAGALDLDDVVEHVMRRLTRSLAVENERHGGRRWP